MSSLSRDDPGAEIAAIKRTRSRVGSERALSLICAVLERSDRSGTEASR